MPDWSREVRRRLSSLRLSPTRETEIVEELSTFTGAAAAERSGSRIPPPSNSLSAFKLSL